MDRVLTEILGFAGDFVAEFRFVFWYFISGVALEALVRTFGWHIKLRKLLDRFGQGSIWLAVGIGLFSPLCACGVLPLTISMLMAGVTLAPAMALLVTSPLMSPSGYSTTIINLGQEWALVKLVAAALMGLMAGYATLMATRWRWIDNGDLFARAIPAGDFHDPDYPCEDLQCDCRKQFSKRFIESRTKNRLLVFFGKFVDGTLKIGKFVLLGVAVEVLAVRYIPMAWITPLFSKATAWNVPLIVAASVPLHVNQVTASFLLSGFVDEGIELARGPGLAFLIGAPVTAIPVMGVFLAFFRRRVFLLYMGVCLFGTIALAYLYEWLF